MAAACDGSFQHVREPFHASVATGHMPFVTVTNVVGEVRVQPGEGNIVVVDATKYASTRDELANIDVAARRTPGGVTVETIYRRERAGGVRYTIVVPRDASVRITNAVGTIKVGPVEGSVVARTATGTVDVRLGRVAARLVDLETATGTVTLHIAGDSSAKISATTALGSISSDFPSISTNRSNLVGANAAGRIGDGTATVRLSVKTGSISIDRS